MFKTVYSAVSELGGDQIHEVWIKIFTSQAVPPKNLTKKLPQFANDLDFMSYKGADKGEIKKKALNEIEFLIFEDWLKDYLELNEKIDQKVFDIIAKIYNLTKDPSGSISSFFYLFEMRYFIKLIFQLPVLIEEKLNETNHINMDYIYQLIQLLTKCKGSQFDDFRKILPTFYSIFDSKWIHIFQSKSPDAVKLGALELLANLFPAAEVEMKHNITTTMNFITLHYSMTLSIVQGSNFKKSYVSPTKKIINGFKTTFPYCSNESQTTISNITTSLFSAIPEYEEVDNVDKQFIGLHCLGLYAECAKVLDAGVSATQFEVITSFIGWLILITDDPCVRETFSLEQPKDFLKPIGVNYFTYSKLLSKTKPTSPHSLINISDEMALICNKSNNMSNLISILVHSLHNNSSEFTPIKYQNFLGFILDVIWKIDTKVASKSFEKNWNVFINSNVFNDESDVNLQNSICNFLLKTFEEVKESRNDILHALTNFIKDDPQKKVQVFFPLFNSLLANQSKNSFIKHFILSPCIDIFIDLSSTNLDVFDFMRRLAIADPCSCFDSNDYVTFIFDAFNEPLYRESSIFCIKCGILSIHKSDSNIGTITNIFMFIMSTFNGLIDRKEKAGIEFVKLFTEIYLKITDNAYDTIFQLGIFESFTELGILLKTEEYITALLNLFIEVPKGSLHVLNKFKSSNFGIYDKLASIFDDLDFDITDQLMQMAMVNSTSDKSLFMIRNPNALRLLLLWSKGRENEEAIITNLFQNTLFHFISLPMFMEAHAIDYLIQRLGDFQTDNSLTLAISDLFSKICESIFSDSNLNTVIKFIKDTSYKNPQTFLSVFFSLLKKPAVSSPSSFFHFDGIATGIEGTTIKLSDTYTFKFRARFEVSQLMKEETFLKIDVQGIEVIEFKIKSNSKLLVERNSHKDDSHHQSGFYNKSIISGIWETFIITISPNGISFDANDGKDSTISITADTRSPTNAIISFGNVSSPIYHLGLPFEISEIELTEDNKVIAEWNPRNVIKQHIHSICPSAEPPLFSGKIFPYSLSIKTVVPSLSALLNIIPLFQRLSSDDLPEESGNETLHILMQILTWCFTKRESLQKDFNNESGTTILANYLNNINQTYFTEDLLDNLEKLFSVLTDKGMLENFTRYIWFNFSFIFKFKDPLPSDYFVKILPNIFKEHPEKFCFKFLPYILLSETLKYSPDGSFKEIWMFLSEYFSTVANEEVAKILCSTPFITDQFYPTDCLLSTCYNLITKENKAFMDVLEENEMILPFLPLMNFENARKCILLLVKKQTQVQQENIALLLSIMTPTDIEPNDLFNFSKEILLGVDPKTNESVIETPSFLPLMINALENTSSENVLFMYNLLTSSISKYDNFSTNLLNDSLSIVWIAKLSMMLLDVEKDYKEFAEPFTTIVSRNFANNVENSLSDFLIFCLLMQAETKKNFMNVFKCVMTGIINKVKEEKQISNKASKDIMWAFCIYTFFEHIFTYKEDEKAITSIKGLPDFIPRFYTKANAKLMPKIRINENRRWEEEEIVETILSCITLFGDTVIDINERMHFHALQIIAYSIVIMIRLGYDVKFNDYVNEIIPLLPNIDMYYSHSIASMLVKAACDKEDYNTEDIEEYTSFFEDDDDSNDMQLFLFEDKVERASNVLSPLISNYIATKTSSFRIEIFKRLKIPSINQIKPRDLIYENTGFNKFYSALKSNAANSIKKGKLATDDFNINGSIVTNRFTNSLLFSAGPWSQLPENQNELKAVNRISPSGSRIIQFPIRSKYSKGNIEILDLKLISVPATFMRRLTPIEGEISLTKKEFIFIGINKELILPFNEIEFIFKRNDGIEVVSKKRSYYHLIVDEEDVFKLFANINFNVNEQQNSVFDFFSSLRSVCNAIYQTTDSKRLYKLTRIQEKWMSYNISTYEYIYYMNLLSGRSFADLNNYPLYPAVLKTFSETNPINETLNEQPTECNLDLNRTLRLLSCVKPFNQLNESDEKLELEEGETKAVIPEFFTFIPIVNGATWKRTFHIRKFVGLMKDALESFEFSQIAHLWFDAAFKDLIEDSHPKKILPFNSQRLFSVINVPQNVYYMQKGIIGCSQGLLVDARSFPISTTKVPSTLHGNIFSVSRKLGIAAIGNVYDPFLSVVCLSTGKVRRITRESSLINCASVVDSRFIITGETNCSVNIWNINTLEKVQSTYYHSDAVIAVAANYDVGIVASIDNEYKLVIEMLCEKRFIRVIQLKKSEVVPHLFIFKSGKIVIVSEENGKTKISLLSPSGDENFTNYTDSVPKQCCKCYTSDRKEFLAVLLETGTLKVYSLGTLNIVQTHFLQNENTFISHCRKSRTIIYLSSSNTLSELTF